MTVPLHAVDRRKPMARPFELFDDVAMMTTPDLEWLVDQRLPARTDAVLSGPPAMGKSLLALDLGLSVAAGLRWCGSDVRRRGDVLYLALDGAVGLKARIAEWKATHGFSLTTPLGLHVSTHPLAFARRADLDRLLATVRAKTPVLTIVDTLARVMSGLDENLARDISVVVDALAELRAASGGSVLLKHHTGVHRRDRERGSSALRAAVDTAFMMEPHGRFVRLKCVKQRDAEPFAPIMLERVGPTIRATAPSTTEPRTVHVTDTLHDTIVNYLREHPGLTTNTLVKALRRRREDVWTCLEQLREAGRLRVVPGPRNAQTWFVGAQ